MQKRKFSFMNLIFLWIVLSTIYNLKGLFVSNLGIVILNKSSMANVNVHSDVPIFLNNLISARDKQLASRFLKTAIRWDDNFNSPRFYLAWINMMDDRYEEAQSELLRLREQSYRQFETGFLLGLTTYRAGDVEKAFDFWHECPNSSCEVIFERLNTEEGCKIAIGISPSSSEAYFCLGLVIQSQANYIEAIYFFEKAYEYNQPLKPVQESLSINSSYSPVEALYQIGNSWMKIGELGKAEQYIDEVISINPDHYYAPMYKAIIESRIYGRLDNAISFLLGLLTRYPEHVDAMIHLGLIYEEKGDYSQAIKWYEHATQIMPNYALGYVQLARVYSKQSRWTAALNSSLSAIDLDPGLNEEIFIVGKALFEQGKCNEALPYALQAAGFQPYNATYLVVVAQIYQCLGYNALAGEWYERARIIDPILVDATDNSH